jgi:hypothetical protein
LSQYLALWSSLAAGAGLGAIVQSVSPAAALLSAAAAAGVLAVMTAQRGSAQSGSAQS